MGLAAYGPATLKSGDSQNCLVGQRSNVSEGLCFLLGQNPPRPPRGHQVVQILHPAHKHRHLRFSNFYLLLGLFSTTAMPTRGKITGGKMCGLGRERRYRNQGPVLALTPVCKLWTSPAIPPSSAFSSGDQTWGLDSLNLPVPQPASLFQPPGPMHLLPLPKRPKPMPIALMRPRGRTRRLFLILMTD